MKTLYNYYRSLLIMMVFTIFYLNDAFGQTTDESGTCSPGANVTSGNCSFSVGYDSEVDASDAVAIGRESLATGANSIAIGGDQASASAQYSHVFGLSSASGDYSFAIGNESLTAGNNSFSFGMHLKTESTNDYNMVIGFGDNSSQQRLTNDISNSIMIGVNSTEPTMFIEDAGGGSALGRVGIGTTEPDGILHIMDENNTDTELIIEKADTKEGAILFDNAGTPSASITYNSGEQMILENAITNKEIRFRVSNGTVTEVMTIDGSDLSVGIGVSNPESKLHVNAEDAVSTTENIALFTVGGNTAERFVFTNSSTTNGAFAPVMSAVSRQTDSPALRIQAEVDNSNDTLTEPVMTFQVRNDATTFTNRPLFRWEEPNTVRMQMNAGGNLGIGTTSPQGKLHVNGTLFANLDAGGLGSLLLYTQGGEIIEDNSTINMKEEIENLPVVKEQVLGLRPVSFKWKSACGGQNDIGLIAEEVEQTLPELAVYGYKRTFVGNDGELLRDSLGNAVVDTTQLEVRTVNYVKLPLYLLGVIKEQDSLLQEMNQRIEGLEDAIQTCCSDGAKNKMGNPGNQYDENTTRSSNNELEEYVLLRNDPNPFSDYTDINYETAGCEACQIVIVDLQGRVVKRINVKENAGVVRVYSSEIGQGLFSYSIIRNGVVIATSKMVSSR
jgi:hypothetical protein